MLSRQINSNRARYTDRTRIGSGYLPNCLSMFCDLINYPDSCIENWLHLKSDWSSFSILILIFFLSPTSSFGYGIIRRYTSSSQLRQPQGYYHNLVVQTVFSSHCATSKWRQAIQGDNRVTPEWQRNDSGWSRVISNLFSPRVTHDKYVTWRWPTEDSKVSAMWQQGEMRWFRCDFPSWVKTGWQIARRDVGRRLFTSYVSFVASTRKLIHQKS